MWTSISITLGAVLLIILGVWGAYAVGKKHGKTEIKKENAEAREHDMAKNAEIASKPFVPDPLSDIRRMSR